jgi:hypothetical protein
MLGEFGLQSFGSDMVQWSVLVNTRRSLLVVQSEINLSKNSAIISFLYIAFVCSEFVISLLKLATEL